MNRFLGLGLILAVFAGCAPSGVSTSGGGSGSLATAVGTGTSPYVLLDLQTRTLDYRSSLADVAGNAAYRDRTMVFRRVGRGSAQVLIGVFTVTQAQWARLDSSTPWTAVPSAVVSAAPQGDLPAYGLDYDILVPVLASFAIPGAHLAVPTGAQYETAAGAASGWTWGASAAPATVAANALVRETAVSESNRSARLDANGNDIGGPQAVGLLAANANGLYDIHGNVWQWTSPGTEVRGGSWYDPVSAGRIESRGGSVQGLGSDVPHALIGVRLILVLQ